MQGNARRSTMRSALWGCLLLFSTVASAQSPVGPTVLDHTTAHPARQYQLMKDMTAQMSAMTEEMSRAEATAEQHRQMAKRCCRCPTSCVACRASKRGRRCPSPRWRGR